MENITFEDLNLKSSILKAIKDLGYEHPSQIQAEAIPLAIEGYDLIGQAQTGTGKTAAFGCSILNNMKKSSKISSIILTPTRELAIQIYEELIKLSKYEKISILPIYGGDSIQKQIRELNKGIDIVVGTPGRVLDLIRRNALKLSNVQSLVLDEADEMLNMGFIEDIETVIKELPEERQTLLFSATMPDPIRKLAKNYMKKDSKIVNIKKVSMTVSKIKQIYFEVNNKNKFEALCRVLDFDTPNAAIIFCKTKKGVDELVEGLQARNYVVEGMHGDMSQLHRMRTLKRFKEGSLSYLVATDVAARGIDVDDIEAVFNFDIPQDDEYYVHRIGRTGRAGRCGRAFSFVKGKEVYKLKDIMRYCKTKIYAQPIPSRDDVASIKAEKVLEEIGNIIENENLRDMIELIEQQVNTSDYTAMDIAAAFLKQSISGIELSKEDRDMDSAFDEDTGAEEGMVRLFINIGKKQKIKPGDILGAVAGEAKIPGKVVGAIDMYDNYTFVEVPKDYGKDVLRAMKNVKIKGKSVNVEPANRR